MTFDTLLQTPRLRAAVARLGWTSPTPIQQAAIPAVAAGRDVLGVAQTGTGKTGAYLLPLIERITPAEGVQIVVLCPTRELAAQVAADAESFLAGSSERVALVVGGEPIRAQAARIREGARIVVATPGRLNDLIERGAASLSVVRAIVLDEADRMLDMGFRPQIEATLRALSRERQSLLFSATMPNGVHALALRILTDPVHVEVARQSTTATGIDQAFYSVRVDKKRELLLRLLQESEGQALVFVARKHVADEIARVLSRAGYRTEALHGDRDMRERKQALLSFSEGRSRVLVATDLAQRGLDIEGLPLVINYDMPNDPEDYVHRIGRTGRAGASGRAVTFVATGSDLALAKSIERTIGQEIRREGIAEFDYTPLTEKPEAAVVNRSGSRMGSRRTKDLSAAELAALLGTGVVAAAG